MKTIINYCKFGQSSCILKVGNMYFGYDNDPQYPETLFRDIEKAYIFNSQKEALSQTTTITTGKDFEIIPHNKEDQNRTYRQVIKSMQSEINYALNSHKSDVVKRHYLENAIRYADEILKEES